MVTQTPAPEQAPEQALGRPRDSRIDEAVLGATRELLLEVGYAELSLTSIAERAGTTRPALYRRWPSLAHVVHEAAFPVDLTLPPTTTDPATDVRAMVAGALAAFSTPVARAAIPGLVAAIANDPDLHRALVARFGLSAAVSPALLDVIGGAALFALLLHPDDLGAEPTRSAWIDSVTHLITEGLTP